MQYNNYQLRSEWGINNPSEGFNTKNMPCFPNEKSYYEFFLQVIILRNNIIRNLNMDIKMIYCEYVKRLKKLRFSYSNIVS